MCDTTGNCVRAGLTVNCANGCSGDNAPRTGTVGACNVALAPGNQTNQTGNLYVFSTPTGASLYVDNILRGTTPRNVTGLTVGNHAVRLTKSGYNDYQLGSYISGGQTTTLNAILTLIQNQTNTTTPTIQNTCGANGRSCRIINGQLQSDVPSILSNNSCAWIQTIRCNTSLGCSSGSCNRCQPTTCIQIGGYWHLQNQTEVRQNTTTSNGTTTSVVVGCRQDSLLYCPRGCERGFFGNNFYGRCL